jgi:hypothetical protein
MDRQMAETVSLSQQWDRGDLAINHIAGFGTKGLAVGYCQSRQCGSIINMIKQQDVKANAMISIAELNFNIFRKMVPATRFELVTP